MGEWLMEENGSDMYDKATDEPEGKGAENM